LFTRRRFINYLFGAIILSTGSGFFFKSVKNRCQIADIFLHPSSILHKISKPVEQIDDEIINITKKLANTLRYRTSLDLFLESTIHNGLSAPQIGYSKRIIACGIHGRLEVLINPEITGRNGVYFSKENCLSLPDRNSRTIQRSGAVSVQYQRIDGRKKELLVKKRYAAYIEHEIDHLNGILYIDHPAAG